MCLSGGLATPVLVPLPASDDSPMLLRRDDGERSKMLL